MYCIYLHLDSRARKKKSFSPPTGSSVFERGLYILRINVAASKTSRKLRIDLYFQASVKIQTVLDNSVHRKNLDIDLHFPVPFYGSALMKKVHCSTARRAIYDLASGQPSVSNCCNKKTKTKKTRKKKSLTHPCRYTIAVRSQSMNSCRKITNRINVVLAILSSSAQARMYFCSQL